MVSLDTALLNRINIDFSHVDIRYPTYQNISESTALKIIKLDHESGLNKVFRNLDAYNSEINQNKLISAVLESDGLKSKHLSPVSSRLDSFTRELDGLDDVTVEKVNQFKLNNNQ